MKNVRVIVGGLLSVGLGVSGVMGVAQAASSETARYTHPACEDANAVCGVVVYAVATTSYYGAWARVHSRSSQPDSTDTHPKCAGINKKLDKNIPPANYDTFVLPASCAYKLEIKIEGGNQKDKNLFLTPGCKLITKTDGTAVSNSWQKLEVSPMNSQVPTKNGVPIDRSGHKCGAQSDSGT